MKRIALAVIAAAGLAVTAARADRVADHVDLRGSINFGGPAYVAPAPGYGSTYAAPRGYWREEPRRIWVPPHWEVSRDRFGRPINVWEAGRYVVRSERMWVTYDHHHRERWEQERRVHEHEPSHRW